MTKKPALSEFRSRSAAATDLAATHESHPVAEEALDLGRPLVRSRDTMNGRPDGSASTDTVTPDRPHPNGWTQ